MVASNDDVVADGTNEEDRHFLAEYHAAATNQRRGGFLSAEGQDDDGDGDTITTTTSLLSPGIHPTPSSEATKIDNNDDDDKITSLLLPPRPSSSDEQNVVIPHILSAHDEDDDDYFGGFLLPRTESAPPLTTTRSMLQRASSIVSSVFSSIRSESESDLAFQSTQARRYADSGPLKRAFPERTLALLVTMVIEVPACLMVGGGGGRLLKILGTRRYTLLLGFLPLISAVSGNVGLQCSTLTTRAISHGHVSMANFFCWMRLEFLASIVLAAVLGMFAAFLAAAGDVLSSYVAAEEEDFQIGHGMFATTVGIAQASSIAVAGLTGTLAPIVFTFLFHRDAGKWAGPLETAVQDIAGTFSLVYITQGLLELALVANWKW